MLCTFTKILEPGVLATLATPPEGKDLTLKSVVVNGGENGGDFTLIIGDYQEKYSIDAEDTFVSDHGIMLTSGQVLQAYSETGGIGFYLSGIDSITNEDL